MHGLPGGVLRPEREQGVVLHVRGGALLWGRGFVVHDLRRGDVQRRLRGGGLHPVRGRDVLRDVGAGDGLLGPLR